MIWESRIKTVQRPEVNTAPTTASTQLAEIMKFMDFYILLSDWGLPTIILWLLFRWFERVELRQSRDRSLTPLRQQQTCQPSRFWRDSPAFLPDVPLNHGNVPLFARSRIFFARAQFVTLPRFPDVNANHPIERNYGNSVRFLAKIPNGTATESPCYSVFRNAIDFYRLYTSKKISMWARAANRVGCSVGLEWRPDIPGRVRTPLW